MREEFSVLGKRLPRADAREKVNGEAKFTTDIQLTGLLHAKFLRSPHAHAKIAGIDTTEAEKLPGVKGALTHKNVPKVHQLAIAPSLVTGGKFEYILDETVHYAGEEVAAVAATTEDLAEEALKLIKVEYEVLPAVFDKEEAMQAGAPLAHTELGSNLYPCPRTGEKMLTLEWGNVEKGFAESDLTAEGTYESPLQHPMSPEPRSVLCQWVGNKLMCWASTQVPQKVRRDLAALMGIPISSVSVIATYPVGGYGFKDPEKIAALAALLAKKTGKPIRAVLTRDEDFIGTHRRIDAKVYARIGVNKNGEITAISGKMITNFGRDSQVSYFVPANSAATTFSTLYECQNTRFEGYHVITNIEDHGGVNGFGDPEAGFCLERLVDEAAEKIGMDPVEFRLMNCKRGGGRSIDATPVIFGPLKWGVVGADIDSFPECIRRVAEKARWKEKWRGWRNPTGVNGAKRRGIGVGIGMHHCASFPHDSCIVKLNRDGSADALSSNPDIGQGLRTAMAQVVAEVIGLKYEEVNVVLSDTSVTPHGEGVFANRGTTVGIYAAYLAALDAKQKLLEKAAVKLQVEPGDLEAKDRMIYVRENRDKGIPVAELCRLGHQMIGNAFVPSPWKDKATGREIVPQTVATTIAEVEVDTETGELNIIGLTSAVDCGRAINPTIVENQMDFAVTLGNGWVRTEELIVDRSTGVIVNPNLLDYKIMTFLDMPKTENLQQIFVEFPASYGPFGAKGMSETGMTSVPPAIANAIYNAIGVRIRGDHLTPERILEALGKLTRGGEQT